MAQRRTHEEVVRDEAWDEQYNQYMIKWRRWTETKIWLDYAQDTSGGILSKPWASATDKFSIYDLEMVGIDPSLRNWVRTLCQTRDAFRAQWLEMRNEKEKMVKRGWCHKAEEKQQEMDELSAKIDGMNDALEIWRGHAQLGEEPVFIFRDPTKSDIPETSPGCLDAVFGVIGSALLILVIILLVLC